MSAYAPLLAALVALLVGLAIGKAWERYKLRDGRWIDRRRARESPHYILGLNFLVANQIDLAIEELSRAASLDADALEVHMILGNLYREKGQVGKAITVHQSLLQRPKLTRARARATCCSASASTTSAAASSIARSRRSTRCCGSIRRTSTRCVNLQKLHEEQHQWPEAYDTRQRLVEAGRRATRGRRTRRFWRSSRTSSASRRCAGRTTPKRSRRFEAAIDLDARAVPAYLNLGDVRVAQGNEQEAAAIWETARSTSRPIARTSRSIGSRRSPSAPARPTASRALCRRLIDENPQDWRARLALSRHLAAQRPARATRSTCSSPRSCRTRTRSASTRRSGARSASCTTRRRSSIATAS